MQLFFAAGARVIEGARCVEHYGRLKRSYLQSHLLSNIDNQFRRRRETTPLVQDTLDGDDDNMVVASAPQSKDVLGLNLLHNPPEPLVDLIFVHGLGGGSFKTWSKARDPMKYWPKEWLPIDTAFENARIHSFGYNSKWSSSRSEALNIHDFGKALINDLYDSPYMENDLSKPVILIGHSMGGLVIKKAYLLACQDSAYRLFSRRIQGMLFLATPHRGAQSAETLDTILRASFCISPKQYVKELQSDSTSIQAINDEFRHFAGRLLLRSFYETLKLPMGPIHQIIVSRDSAVLGYSNERSALLNADHRSICKFESLSDPNYITVRNALHSMISETRIQQEALNHQKNDLADLQELSSHFGGVADLCEPDLLRLQESRHDGSCKWITQKSSFLTWHHLTHSTSGDSGVLSAEAARWTEDDKRPMFFLLHGKPGAGKSVAAAHIVDELKSYNGLCSYFFFQQGDRAKRALSNCLRSLALQMALLDPEIRKILQKAKHESLSFDASDARTIWFRCFLNGIFKATSNALHFWVLDAIDECENENQLASLLAKVPPGARLRIFLSSRPLDQSNQVFLQLGTRLAAEEVTADDTKGDLALYTLTRVREVSVGDENIRNAIAEAVLARAQGCFLWVELVMNELSNVYSLDDMVNVFEEIPPGMDSLYDRILAKMSQDKRNVKLSKAILKWIVCTARPLTVQELASLLELDLETRIYELYRVLQALCGNLVRIDKSQKVQIVHQTARTHLLSSSFANEFTVDLPLSHTRIAEVCLEALCEDSMGVSKSLKLARTAKERFHSRPPGVSYAAVSFSYHLRKAKVTEMNLLKLVAHFLAVSVNAWIEHVAYMGRLDALISTAQNLRTFLGICAKEMCPIGRPFQNMARWSTDLFRLATKFGSKLLQAPSSIFWLIPPLCPVNSALAAWPGYSVDRLSLRGALTLDWDDRLTCVDYRESVVSIATCSYWFAVGLNTGCIVLNDDTTFQEIYRLNQGDSVKELVFSDSGDCLASRGSTAVSIWSTNTGAILNRVMLSTESLSLAFVEQAQSVLIVTRRHELIKHQTLDSSVKPMDVRLLQETREANCPRAELVAISPESGLIAVVCRGEPIEVYDCETVQCLGQWHKDGNVPTHTLTSTKSLTLVDALVFNKNADARLLAVSFADGDLAIVDSYKLTQKQMIEDSYAIALACSPNGQILATGDSFGTLQLYDFETLAALYRVNASSTSISALQFGTSGTSLIDTRCSQINVWNPAVLIQNTQDVDGSETAFSVPEVIGTTAPDETAEITAIISDPCGDYTVCGSSDGGVYLHSTETGKRMITLLRHAINTSISHLAWGEALNVLVSTDIASRVIVSMLAKSDGTWTVVTELSNHLAEDRITQVLVSPRNDSVLLSHPNGDTLRSLDGEVLGSHQSPGRSSCHWVNLSCQGDNDELLLVEDCQLDMYHWAGLQRKANSSRVTLEHPALQGSTVNRVVLQCKEYGGSQRPSEKSATAQQRTHSEEQNLSIVAEYVRRKGTRLVRGAIVFEVCTTSSPSILSSRNLSDDSQSLLYMATCLSRRQSVFVDSDLWVWSRTFEREASTLRRHFFIPDDWPSTNPHSLFCVTSRNDAVFVRGNETSIIKNGLDLEWTDVMC